MIADAPRARAKTRAWFPDGVDAPVQYGVRIAAFAIYLLPYRLLPEDRLVEPIADRFGAKLAAATIARMSHACAKRLRGFAETGRDLVAAAPVKRLPVKRLPVKRLPVKRLPVKRLPVKRLDETGFCIGGKTQWRHLASIALLTFYRVCAKRGSLLANVAGIVVHDRWKPTRCKVGCTPCATPIVFAIPGSGPGTRPSSKSRMKTGRASCGGFCAAPVARRIWRANGAFL